MIGCYTIVHLHAYNVQRDIRNGEYNDEAAKAMREILDKLGYDGIIYQNATEDKASRELDTENFRCLFLLSSCLYIIFLNI